MPIAPCPDGPSRGGSRGARLAPILALGLLLAAGSPAPMGRDLSTRIERARLAWGQPGLAVAIAEGGRTTYARGFGVRSLASQSPVTPNTVFGIASCSKSFAAATVAALIDRGQATWDDRVIDHIPWFRLQDPATTREVRLRDLLAMRTGLDSAEYSFRQVSADRADHVRRLRYLGQRTGFREAYVYSTDNYTVVGQAVAETAKIPWEAVAQERLWGPLGLSRTNADHRAARALTDSAIPHVRVDGRWQPVSWYYEDHSALPAGGVNSSVNDLARWLQFQLANGEAGGRQLLSPAVMEEMRTPQMLMRGPYADRKFGDVVGRGPDGVRFESYALGWAVHDYRGHTVVHHAGSIPGFKCMMGFVPEKNLGVAVLLNADNYHLAVALFQMIIDEMLGLPDRDWPARYLDYVQERDGERAAAEAALRRARRAERTPTLPLALYRGTYADEGAFGRAEIDLENGQLVMSVGPLTYELKPWHDDVFEAVKRWPYPVERSFFATFDIGPDGRSSGLSTSIGYRFERLAEPAR